MKLLDGAHHLLPEGEEAVPLQRRQVIPQHGSERVGHGRGVEELVLDDVDALEEVLDRREQAVAARRVELANVEAVGLPAEEGSQLVVIEHVVGVVAGDVLLEQAEAVRVDRADEQPSKQVEGPRAKAFLDLTSDAVLQFLGGTLSEGECDDRTSRHAVGEEVGHSLRDDLRLSRTRGRDDLQMAAAMADCGERFALELGSRHRIPWSRIKMRLALQGATTTR